MPHYERRERGLWLVAAHPAQRKAAYWLCGAGVALIWPLGTLTGAAVGKLLPAPETIGLDAVFPAILLALVIPAFKTALR